MQPVRFLALAAALSALAAPALAANCSHYWGAEDGTVPAVTVPRPLGIKQGRVGDHVLTTILDPDGELYDATMSPNGAGAIAVTREPAEIVLFYGQSNASSGAQNNDIPPRAPDWSSFRSLTFNTSATIGLPQLLTEAQTSGIVALQQHATYTLFPAAQTAFALDRADRREGRCTPGRFFYTVWEGSQPAASFMSGSVHAKNLNFVAKRAVSALKEAGRPSRVTAIVFIQGEAGPWEAPEYSAALSTIAGTIPAEIAASAGQAERPELMIYQITQMDAQPGSNAWRGQLSVARQQVGRGLTLIGPRYQFPLRDVIHTGDLGRKMEGELTALVYEEVVRDDVVFTPLWPTLTKRQGAVIDIRFNLPGGPLAWDKTWIKPVENYGFRYTDDSSSAAIKSVSIVGADTVRITLDKEPTGAKPVISYAVSNEDEVDGWSSGRGQLVSPTTTPSALPATGEKAPVFVNHYAVRFEQSVP